jgi:hypothetical protein
VHFKAYLDESYDWSRRKLYVDAGFYADELSWAGFISLIRLACHFASYLALSFAD